MSNSFKTVLAPNAPWPARDVPMDKNLKSQQPKPKKPAKLNLGGNLDFFAGPMTKSIKRSLPSNLESVMALRGDSRVVKGYRGRDQNLARVTVQYVLRCKICDEYFDTLGEAKEHNIGKRH